MESHKRALFSAAAVSAVENNVKNLLALGAGDPPEVWKRIRYSLSGNASSSKHIFSSAGCKRYSHRGNASTPRQGPKISPRAWRWRVLPSRLALERHASRKTLLHAVRSSRRRGVRGKSTNIKLQTKILKAKFRRRALRPSSTKRTTSSRMALENPLLALGAGGKSASFLAAAVSAAISSRKIRHRNFNFKFSPRAWRWRGLSSRVALERHTRRF